MVEHKEILVVDDDEKIGKLFCDVLKDEGHQVEVVTSGDQAVEALKRKTFNLVFLDMIMPGMNGLETLKVLKESNQSVPVVMMTGYSVLGMLESASKLLSG